MGAQGTHLHTHVHITHIPQRREKKKHLLLRVYPFVWETNRKGKERGRGGSIGVCVYIDGGRGTLYRSDHASVCLHSESELSGSLSLLCEIGVLNSLVKLG